MNVLFDPAISGSAVIQGNILENFLYWLGMLVIVPAGTALILSWLGSWTQLTLVRDFGPRSQAWIGMLGVVIHELSHMVAAICFGHRIYHVRLFNLRTLIHFEPTLGSVKHGYNRFNLYQVIGNIVTGFAPVYGCSIMIGLLRKLLLREPFLMFDTLPTGYHWSSVERFWKFIAFWSAGSPIYDRIIFGVLAFMIVVTGYGLSKADWENVMSGAKSYVILVMILDVLFTVVFHANMLHFTNLAICFQLLWCLQGAAYILAALVVLIIIRFVLRRII